MLSCHMRNVFSSDKKYLFMFPFRLEILRELLPHGEQKRDKASFLLEVTEHQLCQVGRF
jgi:hypothetical protein